MYISKAAAQAIVEEIGEEIHEHVNMMDEDGVIIASTNPARIGHVHQGAHRIITENLQELYVSEETETTKKGINLPLVVRGQIVGVVGITGEKERVAGYGNIVRRMTEIMVMDTLQKDKKRYDRRMRYRFMEEWIARAGLTYSEDFIERGRNLGIDVEKNYRAMAIHFKSYRILSDTLDGQKLLEDMEASIRHELERNNCLYLREPPVQICLIPDCSDAAMERLADQLLTLIREKYGQALRIGFDGNNNSKKNIQLRCVQARRAMNQALIQDKETCSYDNLYIELFLGEVSREVMQEYLDKLFEKLPQEKLGDYMELIEQYFIYEGSVSNIAGAMYIHKNTLQYKLRKLLEYTGKDIRQPSEGAIFYMAMTFYKRLQK